MSKGLIIGFGWDKHKPLLLVKMRHHFVVKCLFVSRCIMYYVMKSINTYLEIEMRRPETIICPLKRVKML